MPNRLNLLKGVNYMRASYRGFWITDDNEKFVGVNLGADYCAEHEFFIHGLYEAFDIDIKDESKIGVELRTATQVPQNIIFGKVKTASYLFVRRYTYGINTPGFLVKNCRDGGLDIDKTDDESE